MEDFKTWKDRVMEIIMNRINFYERNYPNIFNEREDILESEEVKSCLKRLRKKVYYL